MQVGTCNSPIANLRGPISWPIFISNDCDDIDLSFIIVVIFFVWIEICSGCALLVLKDLLSFGSLHYAALYASDLC